MVILANKKINTRFFCKAKSERSNNPQKFIPKLFNPDSGSVISEPLSVDNSYDFHLIPQYVTQGTATPTKFLVAFDSTSMSQEDLMDFTFEQCFNYYNW